MKNKESLFCYFKGKMDGKALIAHVTELNAHYWDIFCYAQIIETYDFFHMHI